MGKEEKEAGGMGRENRERIEEAPCIAKGKNPGSKEKRKMERMGDCGGLGRRGGGEGERWGWDC